MKHIDGTNSVVLTRFTNGLVKSRPLKENGAEQVSVRVQSVRHHSYLDCAQLLIDLSTLKTCLLKLPGDSLPTSGYIIYLPLPITFMLIPILATPGV
jgi:vacuolar protein sorting-associated protein 53